MARYSHVGEETLGAPSRLREAMIILAGAFGIFWIGLVTYRQIQVDRDLAFVNVRRNNETRVQGFEQFVVRTIETADLAARQIEANFGQAGSGKLVPDNDPVLVSPVFSAFVVHRTGQAPVIAGRSIVTPDALKVLDEFAGQTKLDLTISPPIATQPGVKKLAAIRKMEGGSGYVAVLMEPSRFTDFARGIPFGQEDLISLIGLDGNTRARRTGDSLSAGEPVKGLVMQRQLANPNGTYVGPSVLDGIPRVFSHRRLAKYDLFATSGTPLTVVDDRIAKRRVFQIFAALVGTLFIAGGITAIIIANRRRHRRLVELVDANARLIEAQRIGAIGDWDYYPASDKLYWSDNLCAMYGRTRAEMVSTLSDVSRHVSTEDTAMIGQKLQKILQSGEQGSWEFEAILGDGSRSQRRIVAAPIRRSDGEIIGVHGTDQDIDHIVQARQLELRLAEIARLESVNSLAATLAHELNQPLGITANYLGAVRRLIEEGGPTAKVLKYVEASQDQLQHLSAIIDGARDLVTPGKIELEKVDLHDAIESVMALLRGHSGRRAVNYAIEIAGKASIIWTSGAQLKQVLFNLAKNSLEAIPADTVPEILFRVSRARDGKAARIDVADNGSGLKGLHDPFAALITTKPTGLGLGLSLARTIVEAHGGKIWVNSTGSQGTIISFTIGEER